MSAIYYIGHYDLKDEPRSVSPAAVTMMDYVSEVIQRCLLYTSDAADEL